MESITISAGSNFTLNMATASTTIAAALGFASSTLSGAKTYTGTLAPAVSSPQHLEINFLGLPTPNYATWERNYAFIIPVNVNVGGFIEYKCNDFFEQWIVVSQVFQNIHVQLLSNGTVVNLQNLDWFMIMEIEPCECGRNIVDKPAQSSGCRSCNK